MMKAVKVAVLRAVRVTRRDEKDKTVEIKMAVCEETI